MEAVASDDGIATSSATSGGGGKVHKLCYSKQDGLTEWWTGGREWILGRTRFYCQRERFFLLIYLHAKARATRQPFGEGPLVAAAAAVVAYSGRILYCRHMNGAIIYLLPHPHIRGYLWISFIVAAAADDQEEKTWRILCDSGWI